MYQYFSASVLKKFVAVSVLILAFVAGFMLTVATASAQSGEGALEGFVFLDEDGDGSFDLTEAGIEGLTVRLEGEVEDEVETTSTGAYRFSDLPDGEYSVVVEPGDDYVSVEFDRVDELEPGGVEISSINFALQNADDAAADEADDDAADDEDEDAADDEDADATDEDDADEEADTSAVVTVDTESMQDEPCHVMAGTTVIMGDCSDEDIDRLTAAIEDGELDADDIRSASDDMDDAAMSAAATELIGSLSEDEVDPVVVAAFMAALDSAEEDGTNNETTEAIRDALAEIDPETLAAAEAINAADEDADDGDAEDADEDEGDEADEDDADEGDDAADSEDVDDDGADSDDADEGMDMMSEPMMPEAGGGPLEMGLLAVLALLMLAFAGRALEGRQGA